MPVALFLMTAPQLPPASPSRLTIAVCLVVAVVAGALVALQARINGQLGASLADGSLAAVISFGTGLILVLIALVVSKPGRVGIGRVRTAIRLRELPWYFILGGFGGGLFVLSQGLTVGIIGVALFTVAAVAGQTISGLVIDARGIGRIPPKRVTPARIIGSAIALIAVGITVGPQIQQSVPFWVVLAPLVVGLVLGWQQAVNGQVKTLSGSAVTATFFNFLTGTALLLVIAIVNVAVAGWPRSFPSNPTLYLGGVIGVLFIGSFAIITPLIGVLLQSLAAVAGQLLMSLLLAVITPTSSAGLAWTTVFGTVLTLVGVVIATVRRRALPTASSAE
jgi:transporter family-2 protein